MAASRSGMAKRHEMAAMPHRTIRASITISGENEMSINSVEQRIEGGIGGKARAKKKGGAKIGENQHGIGIRKSAAAWQQQWRKRSGVMAS